MKILLLSELINKNGGRIGGDRKIDQINNTTASNLTTDDAITMQRQDVGRYSNYGRVRNYSENDETTSDIEKPEEDKKKEQPTKPKPNTKKKKIKKETNLKEDAKIKMSSLIEDIFKKKDFDREFVEKRKYDLRLNGIQDLESIRDTNPILIRKVGSLKDIIEKNSATGEEKAVILNYLLSMDLTDIPIEYKEELKKKIR